LKKIFSILLLILLTLSISSCVISFPEIVEPPEATDTPTPQAPITPIDPDWAPTIQTDGSGPLPSIADVVEKGFPFVVAITTETVGSDILQQIQEGAGSGWIIREDGIIVTNNHVIEGAEKIAVELFDGRIFETDSTNVFRDPVSDLAVIKINATNLPAAILGSSSQLRVGEWVVALGNPLGQGLRAKEGTVSGVKVSLPVEQGQTLYDLIETSAAINPGNSGGPLINMSGQVIGITSAKMAAVGVEGMGYAISTKTAEPIISQLITRGYIVRPYLGVAPVTVNTYIATVYRLPIEKGVVIGYIWPGGPAAEAGLDKMDVVTHFKGEEVTTAEELVQSIHASEVGEEVEIVFVRGSETKTVIARLSQSEPPQ
jgi:serine protease Do